MKTLSQRIIDTKHRTEAGDKDRQLADAAPDLLEAAKDALESLKRLPNSEGAYRVTAISQLEAAIAKATQPI